MLTRYQKCMADDEYSSTGTLKIISVLAVDHAF